MSEKIVVPALGESITEATVSRWLKNIGDQIETDEALVELETDKVNIEVPSPVTGILSEIKFKKGKTVKVGSELGVVEPNGKRNQFNKNTSIKLIKEENGSDVADLENDKEQRAHRLAYGFTMRSAACDIIRCILPASTKANMGLVGNGRFYSGLITKLLSQELDEGWLLAENIRKALNTQIPTFIKRASKNDYLAENQSRIREFSIALFKDIPIQTVPEVVLIEDRVEDYTINLLANIIFPYVQHSTMQIRKTVRSLPEEKRNEILSTVIGKRRTKRDRPPRAFEYGYPINFDVVTGFAEYRDLQRHRMLTQQRQDMNVSLGYSVPEEIEEMGRGEVVQECFERAESLHSDLIKAGLVREAQYAPLFNHFIRWNMGMNLRELGHLTELRSQKAGHPKYRRTVQVMAKLYMDRHPEMEPILRFVDYNDYDQGITRAEQEARTARKSLATGVFDDMD